jgi:hypothetical protein
MADVDNLLSALEERASTARTIFMLLDSDADGLVAVEQARRCPHLASAHLVSFQMVPWNRRAWGGACGRS